MIRDYRLRTAIGICIGLACLPAAAAKPWVLDTEYNEFRIVVSPRATVADFKAAAVFQERWEQHTGFRPEVGPEPVLGMVNVWIGYADNPFATVTEESLLSPGGYHIQTFDRSWRKRIRDHFGLHKSLHVQERYDLVIVGGGDDGPIAGVNAFFHTFMLMGHEIGAGETLPPPPDRLPRINLRHTPSPEARSAQADGPSAHAEGAPGDAAAVSELPLPDDTTGSIAEPPVRLVEAAQAQ